MKRVVIRESFEGWYALEWLDHSNEDKIIDRGTYSACWNSARIVSDGFSDVEGTADEMLAIADSIKLREAVEFRRCAIRFDEHHAYLCSPRNSNEAYAKISLAMADDLAGGINLMLREVKEWKEVPGYGDKIPLNEFIQDCKSECFMDFDGHGEYCYDDRIAALEHRVSPSDVIVGAYDSRYTHVIWYNK